jgi:hypothetical protein
VLARLHSEPPEGFYDPPKRDPPAKNPLMLPEHAGAPDQRSRPKRALDASVRASKAGARATKVGAQLLGRLIRRKK